MINEGSYTFFDDALYNSGTSPASLKAGAIVMQITFERSGGFAGLITTTTVDTATLPPAAASRIRLLVEAANFFQLPSTIASDNQADRFQYQLTVQEGNQHHSVTVGESTMPGTLRPLIDCLMETARQSH